MTLESEIAKVTAIAHPHRYRIIAALSAGKFHVSELARHLGMSRPLLYMHLQRLEEAGFVTGHHELSTDGKALKYFEVTPFSITLDPAEIIAAVQRDEAADKTPNQESGN